VREPEFYELVVSSDRHPVQSIGWGEGLPWDRDLEDGARIVKRESFL